MAGAVSRKQVSALVVLSVRTVLAVLAVLTGATVLMAPVHAQTAGEEPLDPRLDPIRATLTEEANEQPTTGAEADSTEPGAARPAVGTMVWRTMTSPSGRTFQVLEPASPGDLPGATTDGVRRQTADDSPAGAIPVRASGTATDATPATGPATGTGPGSDMASIDGTRHSPYPTRMGGRDATNSWAEQSNIPPITAFGVYGGYASIAGLQMAIPVDSEIAFRMGLTGFPGVGWLWTPGIELRFGHVRGTQSTDGVYGFSNLYIGETSTDDAVEKHWGVETGGGYRWILPDRRGVRWIAGIELGGRWAPESSAPQSPTIRAFWMIAAP